MTSGAGWRDSNLSSAASNSGYSIRVGSITTSSLPRTPSRSARPAMTHRRSTSATWWIASLTMIASRLPCAVVGPADAGRPRASSSAEARRGCKPGSAGSCASIAAEGSTHKTGDEGWTRSRIRRVNSPVPQPTSAIRSAALKASELAIAWAIQPRNAPLCDQLWS